MKPVKVIQIGTGHDHAHYTMDSMRKLDCFEVVGVYEPTPEWEEKCNTWESFRGIPHFTSLEEALSVPGLEAVAIETDELSAEKFALPVLEKGLALHLDKPGAYDPELFRRTLTYAKEHDIPLQMGYMYRYNPQVRTLLKEVKEGKLGEIFSVETHMSVRHPKEKREWLGNFKGGMMYFLGCHLLDLILQIQGFPEKITALNRCTGSDGEAFCEDFGFAILEYPNGVSTIKTCAAETNGFERRQLVVTGSLGTYEIKPLESKAPDSDSLMYSHAHVTYHSPEKDIWRDEGEDRDSEVYDRYDNMMADFAAFARREKQNPYDLDYEIRLFDALMECCGR